jgi:NADH:ubiquinone oxidoreductase subunit E
MMFDNVINEDAIQELTPEQIDQLLSVLEKAGY